MMGIWQGFKTLANRGAVCVWLLSLVGATDEPVDRGDDAAVAPVLVATQPRSTGDQSKPGEHLHPAPLKSTKSGASRILPANRAAAQGQGDELERLRGMLDKSGPDGKTERESAIAQLMAMARPEAHRMLHDRLRRREDPDQLRASILDALQKHLLGNPSAQFGEIGRAHV